MAGHIAIPCDGGTCSYAAPNAKFEAEHEVLQPWICEERKMVLRSAFETLVRLAVVK